MHIAAKSFRGLCMTHAGFAVTSGGSVEYDYSSRDSRSNQTRQDSRDRRGQAGYLSRSEGRSSSSNSRAKHADRQSGDCGSIGKGSTQGRSKQNLIMASRKNKITHDDKTKKLIQASQLLNRLISFANGEIEMTQAQVNAARVVIGKSIPDLKSVEISGNEEKPLRVAVGWMK